MDNKVTVKIYGQEYTISGEGSREHIMKVADYVDGKMFEISKAAPGTAPQTIAMLTAVNISDEYFTVKEENEELIKNNEQLKRDMEHYVQLWDEAKRNFMQCKDETATANRQKEELMETLRNTQSELESAREEVKEAKAKAEASSNAELEDLQKKCKEMEVNFFDLQMENIRLKSEVDHYKSLV